MDFIYPDSCYNLTCARQVPSRRVGRERNTTGPDYLLAIPTCRSYLFMKLLSRERAHVPFINESPLREGGPRWHWWTGRSRIVSPSTRLHLFVLIVSSHLLPSWAHFDRRDWSLDFDWSNLPLIVLTSTTFDVVVDLLVPWKSLEEIEFLNIFIW